MAITISSELSWAFIITCVTTTILVQARDPKSEVEAVPGIIYPSVPNQICMLRKGYECRWTIEKSCSCNLTQTRPLCRFFMILYFQANFGDFVHSQKAEKRSEGSCDGNARMPDRRSLHSNVVRPVIFK
ncbi:hypothetical protein TSAR_009218 [Trichomalopsis sarcophagae]|uniref:Uncharacterized protein n=1 Tax=Trichomalopsis sarcophagae TaxID=543379 RepID=A0A232FFK9_9HYME|nr:hypothetical protein TSAR_009218 [Trichomalopsis sarcophagae]